MKLLYELFLLAEKAFLILLEAAARINSGGRTRGSRRSGRRSGGRLQFQSAARRRTQSRSRHARHTRAHVDRSAFRSVLHREDSINSLIVL